MHEASVHGERLSTSKPKHRQKDDSVNEPLLQTGQKKGHGQLPSLSDSQLHEGTSADSSKEDDQKYNCNGQPVRQLSQQSEILNGSAHSPVISSPKSPVDSESDEEESDDDSPAEPVLSLSPSDRHRRVCCGCFMKLDPDHTKNGRCENLMAQMRHKRREQYCRYCRRTLEKGKIDTYFDLFKHWQLLDEDDKKLLRLRLKKSSICQHCFRSYKSNTRGSRLGLNRFQVELEVLSYYVFVLLIWYGICTLDLHNIL